MPAKTNHERFFDTFAPYRGREFTTSEIDRMLEGIVVKGSRLPNDHAEGNKGACACAQTDRRVFDKLGHGRYRVR